MGTPEYQILIDAETEFEDFMGIQLIQENRQSIFYVKVNLINLSHVAELSILPVQIWITDSKLKSQEGFKSVIQI